MKDYKPLLGSFTKNTAWPSDDLNRFCACFDCGLEPPQNAQNFVEHSHNKVTQQGREVDMSKIFKSVQARTAASTISCP